MISPNHVAHGIATPVFQQVERYLRRQVDSGDWPAHFKLPAEVDLARQMNVSRTTLRRAIKALTAQGKLVSIHGRGTFVASQAVEQPLADSLVAFSEELSQQGIAYKTRVISKAIVAPPPRVATLLGLAPGELVFALRRVRLVRSEPIIYLDNYVAVKHCPGIEKVDFARKRLFETLETTFNLSLDWGQRSFQAQTAGADMARRLGISPAAPVLYLEQLVYLESGAPIELSDVWLRGDRFRLSAMVKRTRAGTLSPSAWRCIKSFVGLRGEAFGASALDLGPARIAPNASPLDIVSDQLPPAGHRMQAVARRAHASRPDDGIARPAGHRRRR